jgi:hypothetical protein
VTNVIHTKRLILRLCFLSLFIFTVFAQIACSPSPSPTPSSAPLKSIDSPQGGKIVYGMVDGAYSNAAAMAKVLGSVQNSCGERPQLGKVFRVRGSNSDAVFFTVLNRPAGNKQVAGMVIASQTGPNRVEAAMISDDASRFGSTVNPMLQQLFSAWRPGETTAASAPSPAEGSSAPAASMHKVVLRDNTASVNVPDGWSVDPKFGGGSTIVTGPRGEMLHLNMWFSAQDPNGPGFKRQQRMGIRPAPHTVIYPYNVDMAKAFPDIFQRMRASNGFGPARLQIDRVEKMPASKGPPCVNASGQVNPDGKGMREFNDMLCATTPDQYGLYSFYTSGYTLPLGSTDQDRATALAIINSFQANIPLIKQRAAADVAPVLAAMKRNYEAQQQQMLARGQQIVNQIKQVGANATARYNATQTANDAQHRSWSNQQDINSRNIQGFSNYLLDQSVVQDNYRNTHSTEWNRTADTLVKVDPNRYEIVDKPNYWKGTDFSR